MIEISELIKNYDTFRAVDQISFSVNKGEILGFLGLNGAGKSTTLKILAGVLSATSGSVKLGGFDLFTHPLEAKKLVGYIPDRPFLYAKLTSREMMEFIADLYYVPKKIAHLRIADLLDRYNLTDHTNELVESLSHGMRQRLATCVALVHEPEILIIDEPMVGLDPHGARFLKSELRRLADMGRAIILSTHTLQVAEELADRIAIIDKGKIITLGEMSQIRAAISGDIRGDNQTLERIFLHMTDDSYGLKPEHRPN